MNKGHSKRPQILVIIGGGTLLLACVAILLALRSGRRETPLPPVPEATGTPGEVRVKPVVRKDAARKPTVTSSTSSYRRYHLRRGRGDRRPLRGAERRAAGDCAAARPAEGGCRRADRDGRGSDTIGGVRVVE